MVDTSAIDSDQCHSTGLAVPSQATYGGTIQYRAVHSEAGSMTGAIPGALE